MTIFAHVGAHGDGWVESFREGALHPILGWDHLVAMIGVGIVSHRAGRSLVFRVPAAFVASLCIGAIIGMDGYEVVGLEIIIATSVFVLAVSCFAGSSGPAWVLLLATAIFGLVHGIAHGLEIPLASQPAFYVIGFSVASASAHVMGVGISLGLSNVTSKRYALAGYTALSAGMFVAALGIVVGL